VTAISPALAFTFGPYTLVPERQLLLRGDVPVRIGGRCLDILTALVEQPGVVLSKPGLMARVWPTTIVDEGSLRVNLVALRRILGDEARYIATVNGRGYQFIAPVTSSAASTVDAAPAASARRRHNLPTATARIVGRFDAIAAIRAELDDARLLSIVGPGGIGKTTVALAVAESAIGAYRDGVWLVDLAPLQDASLLPNAIATAIGLAANAPAMLDALCGYLRARTMLLVLDSCEHMVDAIACCADRILADAPGVRIVATTREPLRVKGERVRRLPGLGLPPVSATITAQEAMTFPAIELFSERAADRLESFSLSDADAPVVADICRRLDGLALAIELAATRIDAFGVRGLRDQLESRFRLLEGRRAGPERHRTLTATIDWSHDLLSASERVLMRRLSVFSGAFSLASACAIGTDDVVDRAGVVQDLAHLVAKSLVAAGARHSDVEYRLLDTTRAYCLGCLQASGEDQAVLRRHAEHVCAVLEGAATEWAARPARAWGDAYSPFLGDLRGALAWTGQDAAQRLLRIRLTVAGTLLWNHLSLTDECRAHVALAVGELDAAGFTGGATEMQLQWSLAGAAMFTRGLIPEVRGALQRGMDIAVRIGDADHRLRCLRMIGVYELFAGQYDAAIRTLEHFVAVAAVEDSAAVPEGESHLGAGEFLVGRLHIARQRLERLYTHAVQDVNDARFMRFLYARNIDVGNVLSNVQWLMGDCDAGALTAAANVDYALAARHELSLSNALAFALPVFFLSGRHEESRRYLAMLDEQVMRNGIVTWRPLVLFYRGALASAPDDTPAAGIGDLQHAVAALRAIHHLVRMPFYLAVLADALARCGRLAEADTTIQAALDCAHAQNEQWCLPEVWRIHAAILVAAGCPDDAEAALRVSIAIADETGAVSWRLRSSRDLARLTIFNNA
jgi:predicted ATPase/DNA-binding winged helix-turn-helix (wHTH) protein